MEKVKKYSGNNTYILSIMGIFVYVGCHTASKEMSEVEILHSSANPYSGYYRKGIITNKEYYDITKLIHVFEFDTPKEALDCEARLIQKAKEIFGDKCLNRSKGNKYGCKGLTSWNKGIPMREESKIKSSLNSPKRGCHWFTDGQVNILAKECPDGFHQGRYVSEETKKKTSEGSKERFRKNPYSESSKEKQRIRMSQLKWYNNGEKNVRTVECPEGYVEGRLPYEANTPKKSVGQYTLDGRLIKKYSSQIEAVKETGIYGIGACCRGERETAGKYRWKNL